MDKYRVIRGYVNQQCTIGQECCFLYLIYLGIVSPQDYVLFPVHQLDIGICLTMSRISFIIKTVAGKGLIAVFNACIFFQQRYIRFGIVPSFLTINNVTVADDTCWAYKESDI